MEIILQLSSLVNLRNGEAYKLLFTEGDKRDNYSISRDEEI